MNAKCSAYFDSMMRFARCNAGQEARVGQFPNRGLLGQEILHMPDSGYR